MLTVLLLFLPSFTLASGQSIQADNLIQIGIMPATPIVPMEDMTLTIGGEGDFLIVFNAVLFNRPSVHKNISMGIDIRLYRDSEPIYGWHLFTFDNPNKLGSSFLWPISLTFIDLDVPFGDHDYAIFWAYRGSPIGSAGVGLRNLTVKNLP